MQRLLPLRAIVQSGRAVLVLRGDSDTSDPRPKKAFQFKPLQRYNACGTGTSWQFGNCYTGTM